MKFKKSLCKFEIYKNPAFKAFRQYAIKFIYKNKTYILYGDAKFPKEETIQTVSTPTHFYYTEAQKHIKYLPEEF